jgi:hypothetical protein
VQAGVDFLNERRILGIRLVGAIEDDPRDRWVALVDYGEPAD